jgi:predicted phosphodiesterase
MIYITGDMHGDFRRFTEHNRKRFPFEMTKQDSVIICGDFGLLWEENETFYYNLEWLSALPFRILWVTGNHENYNMIEQFSLEEWNGGKVRHILRDKIILLERGQIFTIEDYTFFAFGGASSHDIQGGVFDRNSPSYLNDVWKACINNLPYRVLNESWWPAELPTEEEMQEGRRNLEKAGYQVDYVISHCTSNRAQEQLEQLYMGTESTGTMYGHDVLTDYFEELECRLQYKMWYFGHYHGDVKVDERHRLLYESIIPLGI